jgi:hypothetical protein
MSATGESEIAKEMNRRNPRVKDPSGFVVS